MNNRIVGLFLLALNEEKAISLAADQGVFFSKEEAKIILPFLKKNAFIVDKNHKDELLKKISPFISSFTKEKLIRLIEKLI